MSVINQMLNDLDKRQESDGVQRDVTFLPAVDRGAKQWLLALIGALLLGGAVAFVGYSTMAKPQAGPKNSTSMVNPPVQGSKTASQNQAAATHEPPGSASIPLIKPEPLKPEPVNTVMSGQPELMVMPKERNRQQSGQRKSTLSVRQQADSKPVVPMEKVTAVIAPAIAPAIAPTIAPAIAPTIKSTNEAEILSAAPVSGKNTARQDRPPVRHAQKPPPKMQVKVVKLTLEQRAAKKYKEAQKMARRGLIKPAIVQYQQILQSAPGHGPSRRALVALYFGRENIASALRVLDQGLAIEPDNISWSLLAAKIHYKQKNYVAALPYLQLPVKASGQLEYVALKATALQQLKQFADANREFERLAAANPANGRWWLGLGTSFEALGETTAAIAAYRKSLALTNISQASRQFVLSRLRFLDAKGPQ